MPFDLLTHVGHILDNAIIVVPTLVWGSRWIRRIEDSYKFAKQATAKHLPFIYERLRFHDAALQFESPEHPPVIPVNGIL